jgi:DNA-binding MarR family transcriptional regulator
MPDEKQRLAREAALLIADVYEVAGRLRRSGDAVARPEGQSQARWQILSVISDGSWTVPRVAERLGVTRQNVQRLTDDLCADGLAKLVVNERHARSPLVHLTAAGRNVLGALTKRAIELDTRVGEAIGAREIDRVRAALSRLLVRLRNADDVDDVRP